MNYYYCFSFVSTGISGISIGDPSGISEGVLEETIKNTGITPKCAKADAGYEEDQIDQFIIKNIGTP